MSLKAYTYDTPFCMEIIIEMEYIRDNAYRKNIVSIKKIQYAPLVASNLCHYIILYYNINVCLLDDDFVVL